MTAFENPFGATPAGEWRGPRSNGILVPLPSGNKARLRRTLSFIKLLESGQLSNPLMEHMNNQLKAIGEERDINQIIKDKDYVETPLEGMKPEAYAELLQMVNEQIPEIFVSPQVVPIPEGEDPFTWKPEDPNVLTVEDISWPDRLHAFNFAQGGPMELSNFPEPPKNVGTWEEGGEVQPDTVPTPQSG